MPTKKSATKNLKKQLKLSDMTAMELTTMVKDLRGQIDKTKLENKSRNTKVVFNLRKKLARTLTVLKLKAV